MCNCAKLSTWGKMRLGKGMNAFGKGHGPERSTSLSLDMQDIALLQPKAGLVFLKEAQQGLDVHLMIEIDHLRCGILNFWHCDWLSNYNRKRDSLEEQRAIYLVVSVPPKGLLCGQKANSPMVVMGLQKGTMPQELLKKRPQP